MEQNVKLTRPMPIAPMLPAPPTSWSMIPFLFTEGNTTFVDITLLSHEQQRRIMVMHAALASKLAIRETLEQVDQVKRKHFESMTYPQGHVTYQPYTNSHCSPMSPMAKAIFEWYEENADWFFFAWDKIIADIAGIRSDLAREFNTDFANTEL